MDDPRPPNPTEANAAQVQACHAAPSPRRDGAVSEYPKPPPLFEARPRGESTCSRRLVMDPPTNCTRPATWHVAWTDDMENGLCCDEHYAESAKWNPWDSHPFGGFCNMPGVDWVASWEQAPGYCALPIDDETASVGIDAELRELLPKVVPA